MTGPWFALAAVLASPGFAAQAPAKPAPRPDFGALFLGETGAAHPPDGAAGDYFEHADRPASLPETPRDRPAEPETPRAAPSRRERMLQPPVEGRGVDGRDPTSTAPSEPSALSAVKKPVPPETPARSAAPAPGAVALWQGLFEPLELSPGQAAAGDLDEASRLGTRDYERHVLGARLTRDLGPLPDQAAALAPAPRPGELFVSVEIEDGGLKDAVAGLERSAGFRADPRWPARAVPEPLGKGISVGGWIAADRLGPALQVPSVARLRVHPPGPRAPEAGPKAAMVLGLRPAPGEKPEAALARLSAELGARTGFSLVAVVGLERVPATGERALIVTGEVPVRGLSKLMGHSSVLKMAPLTGTATTTGTAEGAGNAEKGRWVDGRAPASSAARSAAVPSPPRDEPVPSALAALLLRFLRFALARAPYLLALTFVAFMPLKGDWLASLLRLFIPYR